MPTGTYGQIGSGAEYTSFLIVGEGLLHVTAGPAIAGDFDGNGFVDGNDLLIWQEGFGMPNGAGVEHGDADGDADVDGADFLTWQRNLTSGNNAVAAIPEPTSLLLGILLVTFYTVRRQ